MIDRPIPLPRNRHIKARPDRRWPVAFALLALTSLLFVAALALVGWPRLRGISLHYELVRVRAEVESLRYRERQLAVEVEKLRAPSHLAARAAELGLAPPSGATVVAGSGVSR